jgi:hypothetical protein
MTEGMLAGGPLLGWLAAGSRRQPRSAASVCAFGRREQLHLPSAPHATLAMSTTRLHHRQRSRLRSAGAATERGPRTEVLFLTRRAPYPLDNGARARAHRLVAGLAESFATTLLTFSHTRGSADGAVPRAELQHALPGVEIATVPGLGGGKRSSQAASLGRLRSWEFGRYRTDAFGERLR